MSDENPSQETVTTGQDTAAPATEVTKTPGEQPDQADTTDNAATSENEDATEGAQPEKKSKGGFQTRINELTRKNKEKEREVEFWKREALKTANPETKPTQRSESKELDPSDFSNYDEYTKALIKSEAKKVAEEALAGNATEKEAEQKVLKTFNRGQEKFSDFAEVVSNPDIPIKQEVFEAIIEQNDGAEILYHLAQNPDEALKLSRMNPYAAAAEIGRLSAKLSASATFPKTTTAPPPVPTVGTSGSPSLNLEKMSYADYKKAREAGKI